MLNSSTGVGVGGLNGSGEGEGLSSGGRPIGLAALAGGATSSEMAALAGEVGVEVADERASMRVESAAGSSGSGLEGKSDGC